MSATVVRGSLSRRIVESGGYDYEYVDGDLPEALCCGVCTLPFREPHLLLCCGKKICKSCIERVRLQGKPCPYCNQAIRIVLDKELRSKVLDLAVYCSNRKDGCKWTGELRSIQDHISRSCQLEKQRCRYCHEEFIRSCLDMHEKDECIDRPLEAKLDSFKRQVSSQFAQYESKMAECECKIAQLETQLVCPPCKITMNRYTYHKNSKDRWFSPPFYDRPGGYKFCLKVHVSGPRSHVSVFVYLMKGLNDDRLVWPFQGSIEIQLVNQKKHNKSVVIEFDKKAASRGRADRAVMEDTKEIGWGFSQFVPHRRVEKVTDRSQYITDDCLTFIIADITIKCTTAH